MKKKPIANNLPIPHSVIERRIYLIREQKVMLSTDLADLYEVEAKALNQAVRRNSDRFPEDFMFQLASEETNFLRSQIVTLEIGRGHYSKYAPLAFTEHGVAMLSSVLNSPRAVQMNILIIRAFIKMRQLSSANKNLGKRLDKIEDLQKFHHEVLTTMADDIKKIKNPPKTNAIGFEWKK